MIGIFVSCTFWHG